MSAQTVVGIFNTAAEAQLAVQKLEQAGFELDYVDVAHREAANQGVGSTSDSSVGGFFSSLFGGDDNDDARNYTAAAQRGSSVVTVHLDAADQAHRAATILDEAGAIDVDGDTGATSPTAAAPTGYVATGDAQQTAQVIEENLQVGKRTEQTGGVRLRSRIVERPVEASVRLREEHVTVQRTPVNRPATEADFQAFKEGQIELTESAERAVVGKEAHVVEEVSLGKEVTEREEIVRDTVRNTEVDVEQIPTTTNTTTTGYDQNTRSNS
ncbi:MAG: YsnF/AvaK domain-containing protein [Janthinobacterium lividum]